MLFGLAAMYISGFLLSARQNGKILSTFIYMALSFALILLSCKKLQNVIEIKSTTPITPTIEIECKDNICDTTYIYKQ